MNTDKTKAILIRVHPWPRNLGAHFLANTGCDAPCGGTVSGGGIFFGRASSFVKIKSSFAFWNLGVPGFAPVASTSRSVTSCALGRYFCK